MRDFRFDPRVVIGDPNNGWNQLGALLGAAYGGIWNKNAYNRQMDKAARIEQEAMNGGVTNEDIAAAINNRSIQNAVDEELGLKVGGQYPIGEMKDTYKFGNLASLKQNAGIASEPQATAQDVEAAIQQTGDASQQWKPWLSVEDYAERLRKEGLDRDVIEEAISKYSVKRKQNAVENLLPGIMNKQKSGDLLGAVQDALTLRQYDPELSGILLSGTPSYKDMYNRTNAVADMNQKHLWDTADALFNAKETKERMALQYQLRAAYDKASMENKLAFLMAHPEAAVLLGIGNRNTGSDKTIFDSGAFKAANEQVKALNEKAAMGEELTPEEKQRLAQANAILNSAFSNFFSGGDQTTQPQQTQQFNKNDYSSAISHATKLKEGAAGKYSNEQIAQAFREEYGLGKNDTSNAFVEKILSDAGLIGGTPTQQPAQPQAPQEKPWWDRNKRTGLAAMTWDDVGRAIIENARKDPVKYKRVELGR